MKLYSIIEDEYDEYEDLDDEDEFTDEGNYILTASCALCGTTHDMFDLEWCAHCASEYCDTCFDKLARSGAGTVQVDDEWGEALYLKSCPNCKTKNPRGAPAIDPNKPLI